MGEIMKLKKITQKKLNKTLDSHKLWLETKGKEGEQANLSYTDLSYIDLNNVNSYQLRFDKIFS